MSSSSGRDPRRDGLDPVQSRARRPRVFAKNYRKSRYLADSYSYLGFNLKLPLFQDAGCASDLARGQQAGDHRHRPDRPRAGATGRTSPAPGHNPDVKRYLDQARAKALLAEPAGARGPTRLVRRARFAFTLIRIQGTRRARGSRVVQKEPQGGRDRRFDPHRRVGGFPEGVRQPEEVRRGDPRLDHPREPDAFDVCTPRRPGRRSSTTSRSNRGDALMRRAADVRPEERRSHCAASRDLREQTAVRLLYVPTHCRSWRRGSGASCRRPPAFPTTSSSVGAEERAKYAR